jgi:hypothetical protein
MLHAMAKQGAFSFTEKGEDNPVFQSHSAMKRSPEALKSIPDVRPSQIAYTGPECPAISRFLIASIMLQKYTSQRGF